MSSLLDMFKKTNTDGTQTLRKDTIILGFFAALMLGGAAYSYDSEGLDNNVKEASLGAVYNSCLKKLDVSAERKAKTCPDIKLSNVVKSPLGFHKTYATINNIRLSPKKARVEAVDGGAAKCVGVTANVNFYSDKAHDKLLYNGELSAPYCVKVGGPSLTGS